MSLCDVLLAVGLTFGGLCGPQAPDRLPALPPDDKEAWNFKPAPPAPPPVLPPPVMPPVVIERQIPAPAPPAPAPAVAPAPNPYRIALAATLSRRNTGLRGLAPDSSAEQIISSGVPTPGLQNVSLSTPSLSTQEKYHHDGRISGLPVDSSRILTNDRYISVIFETGVNSQIDSKNGGQVILQVSRDVFGYHGRNLLVPKGSRLVCDYNSPRRQGDSRLAFNCNRILMAEYRSEILQLAAPVTDVQGRGGVTGDVDTRFWDRYGTAFILAGISAGVRLATAAGTQTTTTTTSTQTTGSTTSAIADKGAQELSQKLGEIAASDLERNINLMPIITISQGTRAQIRPAQDWYIRRIDDGPAPPPADTASAAARPSTR
jgi:type IV secretion system protein VirB10